MTTTFRISRTGKNLLLRFALIATILILHLLGVQAGQDAWIKLFQALPDCMIAKPK